MGNAESVCGYPLHKLLVSSVKSVNHEHENFQKLSTFHLKKNIKTIFSISNFSIVIHIHPQKLKQNGYDQDD